ncbi:MULTISPECIES: thermonuclease family protein [Leptolyngbya]|uniref:thermonuclease family protein n=1 Tax=Leptolyngbya TaxID=47251 RepID=UPI0016869538|nr:thermonuclease family protein [Leptolyngbya sp. FACHB-1624]MBD1859985.1 thermonuclease family protein [Leptolyngbya sp. FACHB-1624]
MKLLKSGKVLLNALPLFAIAVILGGIAHQKYQSDAALPDYDNPSAPMAMSLRASPSMSQYHSVKRVSDGDTIVLNNGEKVRLCGIDAPESSQPLGAESTANLKRLIDAAGGKVIVTEMERDRYGRIIGEVFVKRANDEALLNIEQLQSGMAYLYERYAKNCMNGSLFPDAESRAKAKKRGVWKGNYQRPWDFRRQNR